MRCEGSEIAHVALCMSGCRVKVSLHLDQPFLKSSTLHQILKGESLLTFSQARELDAVLNACSTPLLSVLLFLNRKRRKQLEQQHELLVVRWCL